MKKLKLNFKILATLCVVLYTAVAVVSCDDDDDKPNGPRTSELARNLDTPWQLAFTPDGRILVSERPGVVRVIKNNRLLDEPWLKLDTAVEEVGESGLTGIVVDPNFSQNGYVYLSYTYALSKSPLVLINRLVRYREDSETSAPVFDKIILDDIPGNYLHNGGPLKFGPDGKLYWTMGEIFQPALAQDLTSLNGKILRLNADGSIPDDNPFPGSYVYSYGHRNPQGIAFHPQTGQLFSTEHGPSEEQGCCMDEINIIEPGKNYGWPVIRGMQTHPDMVTPVYYSGDTTTWAPTGCTFVTSGKWSGSMLFTGLRGEALYRAVLNENDPTKIDTVERYFHKKFGRLREVSEGPDGRLYINVSNYDGRGKPRAGDDKILILEIN